MKKYNFKSSCKNSCKRKNIEEDNTIILYSNEYESYMKDLLNEIKRLKIKCLLVPLPKHLQNNDYNAGEAQTYDTLILRVIRIVPRINELLALYVLTHEVGHTVLNHRGVIVKHILREYSDQTKHYLTEYKTQDDYYKYLEHERQADEWAINKFNKWGIFKQAISDQKIYSLLQNQYDVSFNPKEQRLICVRTNFSLPNGVVIANCN